MASQFSRRQFLINSTLASGGAIAANALGNAGFVHSAFAIVPSDKLRPRIPYGIASGDITQGSAVIWSRSDRPSRMLVEYADDYTFRNSKQIVGSGSISSE